MRKFFTFLLALAASAGMSFADPVSPVTAARFLYNYDCQRNPAYPKQGSPCTLRGFSDPYVGYNGIGSDVKNTPFGPWKLEFVANYTPSNNYGCERVVTQAVNQYYSSLSNQEKEAKRLEVPIFRLWQYNIVAGEYQHASYGIVCAYAAEGNAEDHGALFISSEGNGCFLAGKPHNAQISLSCENDLTTGLNSLVTAASATDPDYDAYMPVILSIDAIGTVELTQHCKDFIEGSSSAYNALTDAQKGQVTNYQVLVDAQNQWAPLVAEAKPYADAVVDLINAIPNPIVYTQSCKNKIDAAQNAYDELTSGQKIFVSNYETLKNALSDLMKAAPYVHILFKANGKEKKFENVTLPHVFTAAEMTTMLKEMYSVEGDYDMYANSNSDAVDISGGKWTINPFMGKVDVYGDLNKFDPETGDMDMIPISLEITLEFPPFEPEPLAECGLEWKDVPEGGVVGTIGHEDEVKLPYVIGNLDFMLALDAGTVTLRLGSTDESVLAVYGFNDFAVNGVGECDVYAVHDEDAVFAYDSVAFHVTIKPAEEPAAEYAEIIFTEAVAADKLAENATFGILGTEFSATISDSGNKMSIDENKCRFGGNEDYKMYEYRLKSGGASSSEKNFITLNIPAAGKIRIAARSSKSDATDRALVIEQGGTELYNAVVMDAQAIEVTEGETTIKVFPYVEVSVTAGSVRVSYTGGMNFYGFGFMEVSTPTDVESVESQKSKVESVKVIRDGQLLIIRDGKTYNVVGTVVR